MEYSIKLNEDELKEFLNYRKNKIDIIKIKKFLIEELKDKKQQAEKISYSRHKDEVNTAINILEIIFEQLDDKLKE